MVYDAFQSIAMELMIFCFTIAIAAMLKVSSNRGCAVGFRQFEFSSLVPVLSWLGLPRATTSKGQDFSSKTGERLVKVDHAPTKSCERQDIRVKQQDGEMKVGHRTRCVLDTIIDQASNKNPVEALRIYADMRSSGFHCQIKELASRSTRHSAIDVYNALVQSAVRAGEPQLVDQFLDDMSSAHIERGLSFYESVMKLLAAKKYYKEALSVYNRLDLEGLTPSPITLSCLINFAVELGESDRALGFFEQLSSTSTPSIRAYMMVLRIHRRNWDKSLEIFRNMQARNVSIDSLILNTVLATGVAAGKINSAEALLREQAKANEKIVDAISYNTMLKGYAHQKSASKALMILDEMVERGVKPTDITFNTAMDATVRGCQLKDAWKVLERMQEAGFPGDKYTCTILLKALHDDTTPMQLSKLVQMLQIALPKTDSAQRHSLFHGILQVAGRLNNTALLLRAFNQMQEEHVVLVADDYQIMIQALAQQGDTTQCSKIWQTLLTSGTSFQQQQNVLTAETIFKAVVDESAKNEQVEGMICAFESLRAVVTPSAPDAKKPLDNKTPQLLQRCRAALAQATQELR